MILVCRYGIIDVNFKKAKEIKMHKNKLSLISLILAIVMIAGALAACGGGEDVTTEAPVK